MIHLTLDSFTELFATLAKSIFGPEPGNYVKKKVEDRVSFPIHLMKCTSVCGKITNTHIHESPVSVCGKVR